MLRSQKLIHHHHKCIRVRSNYWWSGATWCCECCVAKMNATLNAHYSLLTTHIIYNCITSYLCNVIYYICCQLSPVAESPRQLHAKPNFFIFFWRSWNQLRLELMIYVILIVWYLKKKNHGNARKLPFYPYYHILSWVGQLYYHTIIYHISLYFHVCLDKL